MVAGHLNKLKQIDIENLIKALQIFLKYDNPSYPTACEHDILYVFVNPDKVSQEDKEELEKLGFIVDKDLENFHSYKYGSA